MASTNNIRWPVIRPVYKQVGGSVKLGYGTPNSYVDLLFFKATDDINTIVTPMENLSAGIRSPFGFWNRKLVFDLGARLLTRDLLLGNSSPRFTLRGINKGF